MAEEKSNEHPKMLYRYREDAIHAQGCELLHGVPCETLVVDSEEGEADAKADGWTNSPAEAEAAAAAPAKGKASKKESDQ